MSKKLCYICNKPIRWNDRYVLYEMNVDKPFGEDKKIYSHKRTCNRNIWKLESYFAKQHTRTKRVDTKVFNRNRPKTKRGKKTKLSKLCECGVCDHN